MPAKPTDSEALHEAQLAKRRAQRKARRLKEKAAKAAEKAKESAALLRQGGQHGRAGNSGSTKSPRSMAAARDGLMEAFEQLGGVDGLVAWGERYPKEFYALWGRMIPKADTAAPTQSLEQLLAKLDERKAAERAAAVQSGDVIALPTPADKVNDNG